MDYTVYINKIHLKCIFSSKSFPFENLLSLRPNFKSELNQFSEFSVLTASELKRSSGFVHISSRFTLAHLEDVREG